MSPIDLFYWPGFWNGVAAGAIPVLVAWVFSVAIRK